MSGARVTVSCRWTEKGYLVEAAGDVEATTVADLRGPLMAGITTAADLTIILDMRQVEFIDSAGLALLVEARKRLAPDVRSLYVLITPGRQPERVLRLGRFDTILTVVYDLDAIP